MRSSPSPQPSCVGPFRLSGLEIIAKLATVLEVEPAKLIGLPNRPLTPSS
jgi:hypothetical protein